MRWRKIDALRYLNFEGYCTPNRITLDVCPTCWSKRRGMFNLMFHLQKNLMEMNSLEFTQLLKEAGYVDQVIDEYLQFQERWVLD